MKKVEIIKDNCIKCGMCMNACEEVFGYDEEGKSEVISNVVDAHVENIAGSCPTGAIIINENEEVN